jgi:cobalamin biosynthesis protein CbiG
MRLAIGVGCQRGITRETLETAIALALAHLPRQSITIAFLATQERKALEPAVRAVAEAHGWRLKAFPSETLAAVGVPHPSNRPALALGTASVAEAAAMLAAGSHELLVGKQRFLGADGKAATVAIARLSTSGPG